MTIGNRIRIRRKELNMSVDELARKIGKDRSTVYRYESGDGGNIPLELLLPIARALRTSPKQLVVPRRTWVLDLDEKKDFPDKIETSSAWLNDRALRWFDATDGFEFSDRELQLFFEVARYIMTIQDSVDYEDNIQFLYMFFERLNKYGY